MRILIVIFFRNKNSRISGELSREFVSKNFAKLSSLGEKRDAEKFVINGDSRGTKYRIFASIDEFGFDIVRAIDRHRSRVFFFVSSIGSIVIADIREAWYDMTVGLCATLWRCPRRIVKRTTTTTRTRMVAAACEAFTNISTLVRVRTRARMRAHRRYAHYLMAPTYVFAVNRSLKEQSESLGYIGQAGPLLISFSLYLSSSLYLPYAACVRMRDDRCLSSMARC